MKKRLFALLTIVLLATSADSRAEVRGLYHHASSMTFVGELQNSDGVRFSDVLLSTGILKAQIDAVAVSTGSLQGQVDAIIASTGTLQGDKVSKTGDTMTGDLTLSNAGLVISTTTGSKGITFQDKTIQTSLGEVSPASTSTIVKTFSTTLTSGGPCINGSTISFRTSFNARVLLSFVGTMENTNNHFDNMTMPLIDGGFVEGLTPAHGIADFVNSRSNAEFPVSWTYLSAPLSNGVHNFCVSAWTTGGTLSISTGHFLQFSAVEVK